MSSLEEQIAQLEAAIAAQEALRFTIGDVAVEAAIAALRVQLDALHQQQAAAPPPGQVAPEQLLERLQSYLPKGLADKMRAIGRIEGERKQVTVLFADISGYTALSERLDPEEVATLTNEVLKDMAEAVYQYEGYVDRLLGDAVMAVFGAPVAHEDDPERALRSALAMLERFERFNRRWIDRLGRPLELHIGINTGTVIVGNVGSDLRMSYTVMGDTVNTASRLEDAAEPGQILVSRDTYRLTREAFTFLAMEPIRVKGKREPLTVYELQRARLAPRKTRGLRDLASAFVGREVEMAQLRDVMTDLEAGRGRIIVVSGEAGIGKSRLMAEWRREIVVGERVYWAEGRCLAYTTSASYGPFLELIRHYAGIKEEQSEDAARWRLDIAVERFFPGEAEAKAIFANLLALRLSPEESDLLDGLPGEQRRRRLFGLMEELFTRLARERPTVLVVEDMHWADATSLELVEHLLPLTERSPLAVIGVSRRRADEATPLAQAQEQYVDRFTAISLTPLSETTSLEMVAQLLTVDKDIELPSALQSLIVDKAEGNPFFVEEVIRTLIERGALAQTEDGTWEATPLIESVTVPDTLQGLLMARLDRLPAETKWLAQQAAVIGRIFLYRVLRQMAESSASIDADLSRMERDELIRERTRDPELEYMFRHALTQEVAYQSLLAPRRKELHRKVGEALEELFAERIAEFTTIIGDHYLRGEAWGRAFDYLIQAGDAAARLHAHAEARLHYARALQAPAHLPDTEENRRRRVDALIKQTASSSRADSPEENLARLAEAERLVKELPGPDGTPGGDRLRLARVHFWMGRAHYVRGAQREAIGYFQQVLPVAQESGDAELLALPSSAIGQAMGMQGHLGQAEALLGQAIPLLEQTGNWSEWIRATGFHGLAVTEMGDCAAGVYEVQRALARAREMNALSEIALISLLLCDAYLLSGDLPRVIETARQIVEIAEQSGDRLFVYLAHGYRGWAEGRAGQFEAAAASMARSQAVAKKLGGPLMLADHFTTANAEIALGAGRIEEALALAEQAVSIAQKTGNIGAEGVARRVWGQALAALSEAEGPRWDEAEAQLAESLRLLELGQDRLDTARTHVAWGTVCRDQGDLAAAREHWEQAAAQWEASGLTSELERTRALIGALPES
jgi:class 3 adenylate cyclase/tetratricopeptide (TPR) repeat protein